MQLGCRLECVLQRVAVCCSVLQCVLCSTSSRTHTVLQSLAACCSLLQCVAVCVHALAFENYSFTQYI